MTRYPDWIVYAGDDPTDALLAAMPNTWQVMTPEQQRMFEEWRNWAIDVSEFRDTGLTPLGRPEDLAVVRSSLGRQVSFLARRVEGGMPDGILLQLITRIEHEAVTHEEHLAEGDNVPPEQACAALERMTRRWLGIDPPIENADED